MVDYSGIPKPFALTDGIRAEEEDRRMAERRDGSRKAANTAVPRGGTFDVDGDFNVRNGGISTVERGGKMAVQGSMDITDDGQINAVGEGRHRFTREIVKVTASLANRLMTNLWESVTYLQAGLYFNTGGESRGALDPRVVSEDGKSVSTISSVEKLLAGPQVGPNIMARGSYTAGPDFAGIGAKAWDDSINLGGGDGVAGLRGAGSIGVTPWDLGILLTNHTDGPDGIPSGPAIWMRGDLQEGMLRISTRNGVDIEGTFTVNGQPVGGGTWDSITGKPTSFPPAAHSHSISQVTNLQTTLDAKSATTHTHAAATTSTAGFMSAADKTKLNAAAAQRYLFVAGTSLPATVPSAWSNLASNITVPADLFGVGVPYKISVYSAVQVSPAPNLLISLRAVFNGTTPAGAKVNGVQGPNNASVILAADYLVSTSQAVTVNVQAQAPFGGVPRGSGDDAPYFTITATPYQSL